MKSIKRIILVISIVITGIFIAATFTKKDYRVKRAVVINQPVEVVFDYAKYLKNQNNYSVWALKDPAMDVYFTGTDGEAGFVSGWKSENPEVGEGEQEILSVTHNERITYELRFFKPFESTDQAWLTFDALGDSQTVVSWGIHGRMKYPMNIMLWFFDMEDMLANDFEIGLANMKNLLEK